MEWVVQAISAIRALRAEMNVPPAARVPLLIKDAEPVAAQRIERHREHFVRLARVERFEPVEALPPGGVQAVVEGATLILALGEVVDLEGKGTAGQRDRQARCGAGQDCRQAQPTPISSPKPSPRWSKSSASVRRTRPATAIA